MSIWEPFVSTDFQWIEPNKGVACLEKWTQMEYVVSPKIWWNLRTSNKDLQFHVLNMSTAKQLAAQIVQQKFDSHQAQPKQKTAEVSDRVEGNTAPHRKVARNKEETMEALWDSNSKRKTPKTLRFNWSIGHCWLCDGSCRKGCVEKVTRRKAATADYGGTCQILRQCSAWGTKDLKHLKLKFKSKQRKHT